MASTNKKGETACEAYLRNMVEVYVKLEKITGRLIENCADCDNVDWSNVGSAEHINNLLDELGEFVGIK